MSFAIHSDLRKMGRDIRAFSKDAAFAQVVALTRTGQDVKAAEEHEIRDVFDRPTPFTQRAVYLRTATKARPEATVGLKDDFDGSRGASHWLDANIKGGRRRHKAFEKLLMKVGMPDDMFAVPGKFARLDAYGNMSRGQLVQILSQLRVPDLAGSVRALPRRGSAKYADQNKRIDQTIKRAYRRAGGQYFMVPNRRGRMLPGVYLRANSAKVGPQVRPRPVLIFVKSTAYEDRYDFHYVAENTAAKRFPFHMNAEATRLLARQG